MNLYIAHPKKEAESVVKLQSLINLVQVIDMTNPLILKSLNAADLF